MGEVTYKKGRKVVGSPGNQNHFRAQTLVNRRTSSLGACALKGTLSWYADNRKGLMGKSFPNPSKKHAGWVGFFVGPSKKKQEKKTDNPENKKKHPVFEPLDVGVCCCLFFVSKIRNQIPSPVDTASHSLSPPLSDHHGTQFQPKTPPHWQHKGRACPRFGECLRRIFCQPQTCLNGFEYRYDTTQMLHYYGIFTYIHHKSRVNVGKYFHTWSIWGIVVHRSLTFYLKIQLIASIQHQHINPLLDKGNGCGGALNIQEHNGRSLQIFVNT